MFPTSTYCYSETTNDTNNNNDDKTKIITKEKYTIITVKKLVYRKEENILMKIYAVQFT